MTTVVDAFTDKVKLCAVEVEGGVVYIKGYVGDAVFFIKAKISELGSAEALAPFKVSALRVWDGAAKVSGSVGDAVLDVKAQGHNAAQKALHAYLSMTSAISNNVSLLMAPIRERISVVSTKVHNVSAPIFGPCVVYARDGLTYASGKVNGVAIFCSGKGWPRQAERARCICQRAHKGCHFCWPAAREGPGNVQRHDLCVLQLLGAWPHSDQRWLLAHDGQDQ